MEREDIGNVPCLVFTGLSDKEAAETFLRINMTRRALNTSQLQHGELFAEKDLAVRANNAEQFFLRNSIGFESLTALRSCLRSQPRASNTVIELLPGFAVDRQVTGRVFKALVKLEELLTKTRTSLAESKNLKKLQKGFGNLDRVLCAVLPSKGPGRNKTPENAMTVARSLGIRLQKAE
jgi:hypothetical protein